MIRKPLHLISTLVVAGVLAACAGDSAGPVAPTPSFEAGGSGGGGITLTLKPSSATLRIGETLQMVYQLTNPAGHLVPSNRPVSWTSSDERVATVSEDGLVTAVAPGKTLITATGAEATGTAVIAVVKGKKDCQPMDKKDEACGPAEPPPGGK